MTKRIEKYMMTLEEACKAVEQIIARGHDAEVRRARNGLYVVYEVNKSKILRADVGARE